MQRKHSGVFESCEPHFHLWNTLNKVMDSISVFQERQLVVLIYKKCCWVAGKQEGEEVEKDSLQAKPTYTH